MLNATERQFTVLYAVIVLFELITAQVPDLKLAHFIAKPSIVFALIFLVINQKSLLKGIQQMLLISALGFSVIGDMLLMFVNQSEWFFIAGLIAFLIAHVFYIILFLKQRDKDSKPYLPIVLLYLYSLVFGYFITDSLGNMLVPVIAYEIIILLMASAAFLRKRAVNSFSYNFVIAGALFFLVSDSLLALNKFYTVIPLSGVWIMLSYSLAQYCITLGILKSTSVTTQG
jgi:uncharacterized membrane protein YhhN